MDEYVAGGQSRSFPEPRVVDYADAAVRTLVSAIPGLGGPAAQLIAIAIAPPFERRRASWFNDLADRLASLEQAVDGFTVQSLTDNEEMVADVTKEDVDQARTHSGRYPQFPPATVCTSR